MTRRYGAVIAAIVLTLALVLLSGGLRTTNADEVPLRLPFQGQLTTPGGTPITAPTAVSFTLFKGGDATTIPSSGIAVYREQATITPDVNGVFEHQVGSGTPTGLCDENGDAVASETCVLGAGDFPDGSVALFLEIRVDPLGVNDVLLPRQQVGTVGYAMRAATLNGFTAGKSVGQIPISDGAINLGLNADLIDGLNANELIDAAGPLVCQTITYGFGMIGPNGTTCATMTAKTFVCPVGTILLGANIMDGNNIVPLNCVTFGTNSLQTKCVTTDSCGNILGTELNLTCSAVAGSSDECSSDRVILNCCQ